jgi:hypothetical protein
MKLIDILIEEVNSQKIKQEVEDLLDSNPELANDVFDALGFKSYPKKGTSEYNDAERVLELEMMLDELGNEKLRGSFEFLDILVKATKLPGFIDRYVGWRKYYNVITDMETLVGIYGHVKEKEGYTQPESALQELLKLIKKHVKEYKIDVITPQQKQQAVDQFSMYVEKTGSKDISGFKNFIKKK